MPIIDYQNSTDTKWIDNATTYVGGLPLHPSGEMNMIDFYMTEYDPSKPSKLSGNRLQLVTGVVMIYIVIVNVIKALKLLISRPRLLAPWCCFIPCIMGTITVTVFTFMELGLHFTCRHLVWSILAGIAVSNSLHSMILVQKAYLILCKQKWVIYISILPMLCQLSYVFIMVCTSFVTTVPDIGCSVHYPYFTIWFWFSNTLPLNLLFSGIFCYVAVAHYRRYGTDAWKRLAREGIQIMSLIAICNILCCVLLITQIAGPNTDLLLAMDW
ncbi:hypothetical protein BDF22DRAFT_745552 [Syncephalis plumigaleata]|nr:hypothetical protein BDF22DRAFT_745552 [Syncephalis plumigaleata]